MRGGVLLLVAVLAAGCTAAPAELPPGPVPAREPPPASPAPVVAPPSSEVAPGPEAAMTPEATDEGPPAESAASPANEAPPDAPPSPPTVASEPSPPPVYSSSSPSGYAVRFQQGGDAPDGRRFVALGIAPDGGSFSASLRGVPEARLRIDSVARLANVDSATREVTLSSAPVTDPRITEARLLVGGTTLDLRSAEPNVTAFLSPGALLDVGLEIALAGGTVGETLLQSDVVLAVR